MAPERSSAGSAGRRAVGPARRALLVTASAVQLAAGLAGQAVALRRGLAYDLTYPRMAGRPEHVARDSWLIGTALSPPVVMMTAQTAATARLARTPSAGAARALGVLGALMVAGTVAERGFREAVTGRSADGSLSALLVGGSLLAAGMASLGLSPATAPRTGSRVG